MHLGVTSKTGSMKQERVPSPRMRPMVQVNKKDLSSFVEKLDGADREEGKRQGDAVDENPDQNWFELKILGKYPERRGYHSTAVHN